MCHYGDVDTCEGSHASSDLTPSFQLHNFYISFLEYKDGRPNHVFSPSVIASQWHVSDKKWCGCASCDSAAVAKHFIESVNWCLNSQGRPGPS
jgi:hypothetical protein